MPEFQHISVLLNEAVEQLAINPDGVYVDATLGGAGHSFEIATALTTAGQLVGFDQDRTALKAAADKLSAVKPKVHLVKSNFSNLKIELEKLEITALDGILFDLGVSSPQFDLEERGFSYKNEAPLDMRMDQESELTAGILVNTASVAELTRIFWKYGEERYSKRIATLIEKRRREQEITTTIELAELIKQAIPAAARRTGPHPARRVFQALRIAVNCELEVLQAALDQAIPLLKPSARLVVISFHSLEDRVVKETFNKWASGCCCPRNFPICVCGQLPTLKVITKKPIVPTEVEIEQNSRSRSAKLRVAEKLLGKDGQR